MGLFVAFHRWKKGFWGRKKTTLPLKIILGNVIAISMISMKLEKHFWLDVIGHLLHKSGLRNRKWKPILMDDGYLSHILLTIIELPPYTTDNLQQLDLSVFKFLKDCWYETFFRRLRRKVPDQPKLYVSLKYREGIFTPITLSKVLGVAEFSKLVRNNTLKIVWKGTWKIAMTNGLPKLNWNFQHK